MGGPGLAPGNDCMDEEWVARPSTPPAVDSSASRDARVLAYEVWNCLLICMLSHKDCARALFD